MKPDEVIKHLVIAVMNDFRDSPYDHTKDYWNDMWKYWESIFKEDTFEMVNKRMNYIAGI